MSLQYAIDQLYETGWHVEPSAKVALHDDGRAYPTLDQVQSEFTSNGCAFQLKHIQLFDCFRAEWSRGTSQADAGAVVGASAIEAAVFALSQLRRSAVAAH